MPDNQQLVGCAQIPNPLEIAHVGFQCLVEAQRLINRETLTHNGQDCSILGCEIGDIIGGDNAATAGHVDRHNGRFAGNMLADMAAKQS